MSRTAKPQPKEDQLKCLGVIRKALPLIQAVGVVHPVHGNVRLQLTDALVVLLGAFFNPTVRSLRLVELLSQMQWVQGHLNVERVCRSTLSDAFERFEPEALVPGCAQIFGKRDKARWHRHSCLCRVAERWAFLPTRSDSNRLGGTRMSPARRFDTDKNVRATEMPLAQLVALSPE